MINNDGRKNRRFRTMPSFGPGGKWSFGIQPLILNRNYLRSIPGILKCLHSILGFISFLCIWLACRSTYDPYLGTNSGFTSGDIETFSLLFYFCFWLFSTMLLITYYFSIMSSTIIPKTVFEFTYNSLASILLILISVILFFIVLNRNVNNDDGFPPEPGYGAKITSSIFGFINSILYGIDACYAFKSYHS